MRSGAGACCFIGRVHLTTTHWRFMHDMTQPGKHVLCLTLQQQFLQARAAGEDGQVLQGAESVAPRIEPLQRASLSLCREEHPQRRESSWRTGIDVSM